MNHPQNENTDQLFNQQIRTIVLPAIKISLELKGLVLHHVGLCTCADCVGIRAKMAMTECVFTIPESAQVIYALAQADTDASLDLAGTICYASGEAFGCRVDLHPRVMHKLEQAHAYLRTVIEAKRLLLWFHQELHKVASSTVRVAAFPLHTEDGIIRFDKDTRMRVKAAAVEFAKRAGLPKKD